MTIRVPVVGYLDLHCSIGLHAGWLVVKQILVAHAAHAAHDVPDAG